MSQTSIETKIETMLRQKIGLDAASIGSNTIARSINQRRTLCGLSDLTAYWYRLQTSPQEVEALIEAVVVPETWFFRDQAPFVCLSQFVKTQLVQTSGKRPLLRVLSVPCSTGEEPYSIAITLFESGLTAAQFQIDAIDISQQALQKANRATYSKKSFRGEYSINQRYFQAVKDGVDVRSWVRETVHFRQGNLLDSALLLHQYHIVFCRNLLIYLDQTARNQVLERLDRALMQSGLLFVGAAETSQITAKSYVSMRYPSAFAYQKQNLATFQPAQISEKPTPNIAPQPAAKLPVPPPISALDQAKRLADRGQLIEAANLAEACLSHDRSNAHAHLLLGEIYQELNDLERAERSFQRALYLNSSFYEALIHLALLKEQQGDTSTAILLRARIQRILNP
ncbi:CheR family methyltransferase [Phormidesmis sp. 146-33]